MNFVLGLSVNSSSIPVNQQLVAIVAHLWLLPYARHPVCSSNHYLQWSQCIISIHDEETSVHSIYLCSLVLM